MSFIRSGQEGEWEDVEGMYVYPGGGEENSYIVGLSNYYPSEQFVELAMRMLDQSGNLTDEELEKAHDGFRERLMLGEYELDWDEIKRDSEE